MGYAYRIGDPCVIAMRRQGATKISNLEKMLRDHYAKLSRDGHNPYPGGVARPKAKLEDMLDQYIRIYRRGSDK